MRVYVGGDHAAFTLKGVLVQHLRGEGHDVVDVGPLEYDELDDYPVYVLRAAQAVADTPGSRGVVLGGSGNGECIAANKVLGIRCALVHSVETARMARLHNDAQIMAVGERMTPQDVAVEAVDVFLSTEFTDEVRHARRVGQLQAWETDGALPPLPEGAPDVLAGGAAGSGA